MFLIEDSSTILLIHFQSKQQSAGKRVGPTIRNAPAWTARQVAGFRKKIGQDRNLFDSKYELKFCISKFERWSRAVARSVARSRTMVKCLSSKIKHPGAIFSTNFLFVLRKRSEFPAEAPFERHSWIELKECCLKSKLQNASNSPVIGKDSKRFEKIQSGLSVWPSSSFRRARRTELKIYILKLRLIENCAN